jgi:hypothetical protein
MLVVGALLALLATPAKLTSGGWITKTSRSAMDDSVGVQLSLRASKAIQAWPSTTATPTLILRCQEGQVDAFMALGVRPDPDGVDSARLVVRFDQAPATEVVMGVSTDGLGVFFHDPTAVIASMLASRRLLIRVVPFNSNPQETSFNLAGLSRVIAPLQTACDWYPAAEQAERQAADERACEGDLKTAANANASIMSRTAAAERLGNCPSGMTDRLIPPLVALLRDPDYYARIGAVSGIEKLGPRAVAALPDLEAAAAAEHLPEMADRIRRVIVAIKAASAK